MSRATSVIDVAIIGDARKLVAATGAADKATGGLVKSTAKIVGTGLVIDKAFEFLNGALDNADALDDATNRLEGSLGDLAKPLEDAAAGMDKIGLSRIAFAFPNFAPTGT